MNIDVLRELQPGSGHSFVLPSEAERIFFREMDRYTGSDAVFVRAPGLITNEDWELAVAEQECTPIQVDLFQSDRHFLNHLRDTFAVHMGDEIMHCAFHGELGNKSLPSELRFFDGFLKLAPKTVDMCGQPFDRDIKLDPMEHDTPSNVISYRLAMRQNEAALRGTLTALRHTAGSLQVRLHEGILITASRTEHAMKIRVSFRFSVRVTDLPSLVRYINMHPDDLDM